VDQASTLAELLHADTDAARNVLAYNLTRVMNIIGVQPLLAVMRA
jgi:hypothetical protein